ncbi:MAG: ArnT family glycosyltransferase, partial [Nitrospinales bacterium]
NLLILIILFFLALTLAQAPAIATDALVYHLAVPKAYLNHHGIISLPDNIYSFFPMQFEMVYLFCLGIGGETAAKLAGLGMAFLLLGAMSIFYKQYLAPRYSSFVPVLYFATPTFFLVSSAAYVDVPLAGFIFLTYYAWDRWRTTDQNPWFILMILFAGSAVATKLTAVIVLPLIFLGIAFRGRDRGDTLWTLQRLLVFFLAAGLFIFPWWARNYQYTGNPFAPFFMQFFGGESGMNWDTHRSLMQMQYYKSFGMGSGLKEFFMLPAHLTFFSEKNSLRFDGAIGLLYFLLIPAWFGLGGGAANTTANTPVPKTQTNAGAELIAKPWGPQQRIYVLTFIFFVMMVFWFIQTQYIRLLTPAFTFLVLISVYGFERMVSTKPLAVSPWRGLIFFVVVGALLFNLNEIYKDWKSKDPLKYLMRQESREQYLARHIPSYPLFQTINQSLGKDSKVLFVFMRNLGYLSDRDFISDSFFEAHTLQTILQRDASIEGIARQLRQRGITHILFDNQYMFGQNTAFSPDHREALKNFFNAKTKLTAEKNGYYLYQFMLD